MVRDDELLQVLREARACVVALEILEVLNPSKGRQELIRRIDAQIARLYPSMPPIDHGQISPMQRAIARFHGVSCPVLDAESEFKVLTGMT